MKVRVYFNLHKKLLSVQTKVNGSWKVIKHVFNINLTDVKFKVSEAGRQRVLREKRKNVHAFIEGVEVDQPIDQRAQNVTYNPYKYEKFTTGEKYVDKAEYAVIMGRTILAINPH
jgi:hypothetical protein